MKIVLASALFPPDTAQPAPYVKELARRLAPRHEVTLIVYGEMPEEVPGARIVAVSKRSVLPLRLVRFAAALRRAARGADIVFLENSPSIELPALVLPRRAARVLHLGDRAALGKHPLLQRLAARRAHVVGGSPEEKPEILPFSARPEAALAQWEESWRTHIATLERIFNAKN